MNFLKKLTGLFVFVLAIAGAIAVSRYFSGPRPPAAVEVPATPPAPPAAPFKPSFDSDKPSPPELAPPPQVFFKARLVTLDLRTKKSHVTLELERGRDRDRPAPERVWAWVSFFSPEDGGRCAAEPVEVRQPFSLGARATVVVEADASACGRPRPPTASVYANVHVSAVSAERARLDDSQLTTDTARATPVVVTGLRR